MTGWKKKAGNLRRDVNVLFLAYRDPRVGWHAKVVMWAVIAYALCPLDLIPDFIPVIGLLDDLILIPVGVSLALRLIPAEVIKDCRRRVEAEPLNTWSRWLVASLIVLAWVAVAYLVILVVMRAIQ